MINEILFMNGYGAYVWSSFIFTLIGFFILYSAIKLQLIKEQKKFDAKFKSFVIAVASIMFAPLIMMKDKTNNCIMEL